jgi:tetratricopeptide (TPR) repeat protein/outer membrane protein OmpA-like peptidoglycan-associated protein
MKKFYQTVLKVLLSAFVVFSTTGIYAQQAKDSKPAKSSFDGYWYIGANGGLSLLHGDITKYRVMPDGDNTKFGFSGYFGRQLTPVFGLRGQLGYGQFAGKEDRVQYKGFDFFNKEVEGDWIDYSLQATFDLDNLILSYNPDRLLGVYTFLGYGNAQYKSQVTDYNTNPATVTRRGYDETNGDGGKGFGGRRIVAMVPVGLGFNIRLAEKWDANIESSVRWTDTEGMDIVHGGAKEIKNDFYSYTSLGLTYKFGSSSNINKMKKDYGMVKYDVVPEVLETTGDSIRVTIRGVFPPKYFHKKAAMHFQPVLRYMGDSTMLKPIVLRGENVQGEGDVISYANGGTFTYKATIPYKPEMNTAELHVNPFVYLPTEPVTASMSPSDIKTKYKSLALNDRKLADGVIYTCKRIKADQDVATAAHGYQQMAIETKDAAIYFPKNKYDVNYKFGKNKDDQSKTALAGLYDYMKQGHKVKDITITAWASPEGEETFNANLSKNRGEAAKKVVVKELEKMNKDKNSTVKFDIPAITFNVAGNGPDWNGFMKAVEGSTIKDKNVVLNVVNSADPKKKEEEIRNMIVIYPEIEENLLPPLRRAEIAVNTFEPKRTNEEIAQLATTNPEQLTEPELLFAATLTQDVKAQAQIYKSATTVFPNSWKAYNNAGMTALKQKDFAGAESYLNKANTLSPDNGEVINNLGVVAIAKGEPEKAQQLFEKAKKLGVNENYNLATLMIAKGKYAEAVHGMKDRKCSYNLALAQILSNNTGEAARTLDCAEKDAATYYLTAVLGARTANAALLYENLEKAVKADASLKGVAKTDREFIKYFETPEFSKIVE